MNQKQFNTNISVLLGRMTTILIMIFLLVQSIPLYSQDIINQGIDKLFDMSIEELMNVKIVSVSKTSEKLSISPAIIFAVSEDEICSRGYNSLEELLEDIPGIEIQRKSRTENANMFTLNGVYGFNKFLILKDGVQISSVTGSPHSIGHSYSLQNAKQVEVILGPVSAIYGADAYSGVINIITKRGKKSTDLVSKISYGMYNNIDFLIDKTFVYKDAILDVNCRYYHTDGPDFPDIYKKEYSWYNNNYVTKGEMLMFGDTVQLPIEKFSMPSMSYLGSVNLNIQNFNVGYNRNFESQSSSISNPPDIYLYSKDAVYQNTIETAYVDHHYESEDNKLKIHSLGTFQSFRIVPETNFINQYSGYNQGYKYAIHKTFNMEENINISLSENSYLNFGINYQSNAVLPKTSDLPEKYNETLPAEVVKIPYIGTDITDMWGNDLTIYQNFYYTTYQNFGSFFHITGKISQTLSYNCGARYDYNTRYKENFSPRLSLIYYPTPKLSMKLIGSKAFLAPSPFETYQHYGSFYPETNNDGNIIGLASGFWRLPNPDLEPEYIHSVECDLSYLFSQNLYLRVITFNRYIYNLITTEGTPNYEFQNVNVAWVEQPVNKGKSLIYGSSLILQGHQSLSSSSSISYHLGYTYTDGNIADEPLLYSAKHTVKTGLNFQKNDKINIYLSTLYRSKSHHRRSTNEINLTNESFYIINLYSSYKIIRNDNISTDIFLKVNNVLNQKYYHTGYENFIKTPQNTITVSIGIITKF